MDIETARWLVSEEAAQYIAQAHEFDDPSSLKAGTILRTELSADRAAAVADLESLRRRGTGKLGEIAHRLFLTHDGLEQATRFPVAQWRVARMTGMAEHIIDAGCGLGIDALAHRMVGMEVTGIEMDPVTAIFAEKNLSTVEGPGYEVRTGTIEDLLYVPECDDANPRTAIFLDPARRTSHGRSWNVEDLSPSWEFVLGVLHRSPGPVVVKLAPGFPRRLLPDDVDVTWVSHRRNLVETTLWSSPGATGKREAVVVGNAESHPTEPRPTESRLPAAPHPTESRLLAGPPPPAPGLVGEYILEPDPAVIRAGAIGALARMTSTHPMAESIAYLTGPEPVPTPFATSFQVLRTFDFSQKELRAWVRDQHIGVLEIKLRGLDIDPAQLRRTLKLKGNQTATIILAPTLAGVQVFIVQRIL